MALAATVPECNAILVLSTNVIEILSLRDVLLGEPGTVLSTATVTARILDPETPFAPIGGIPDPISLAADGAGNPLGNYRGLIPSAASLTAGDRFRAVITAIDSGNTLTIVLEGLAIE